MTPDAKAATNVFLSVESATLSIASEILPWVQIIAGIVAIVSGLAATRYYMRKARG